MVELVILISNITNLYLLQKHLFKLNSLITLLII